MNITKDEIKAALDHLLTMAELLSKLTQTKKDDVIVHVLRVLVDEGDLLDLIATKVK